MQYVSTCIVVLLCLASSLDGCYTALRSSGNMCAIPPRPTLVLWKEYLPVMDFSLLPDSGFYYIFSVPFNERDISNPDKYLLELYQVGFDIVRAWHYPGSGDSCHPTGSVGPKRISLPYLIIWLEKPNDYLFYEHFREIKVQGLVGHCAYSVIAYRIRK